MPERAPAPPNTAKRPHSLQVVRPAFNLPNKRAPHPTRYRQSRASRILGITDGDSANGHGADLHASVRPFAAATLSPGDTGQILVPHPRSSKLNAHGQVVRPGLDLTDECAPRTTRQRQPRSFRILGIAQCDYAVRRGGGLYAVSAGSAAVAALAPASTREIKRRHWQSPAPQSSSDGIRSGNATAAGGSGTAARGTLGGGGYVAFVDEAEADEGQPGFEGVDAAGFFEDEGGEAAGGDDGDAFGVLGEVL